VHFCVVQNAVNLGLKSIGSGSGRRTVTGADVAQVFGLFMSFPLCPRGDLMRSEYVDLLKLLACRKQRQPVTRLLQNKTLIVLTFWLAIPVLTSYLS